MADVALVVLGVRPFGLDEFSSVAGTVAVTTICVLLAAITFLKGRILLGVVAIFIPLVGAVSAVRLAKPTSAWARRRYTGPRASRLRRAQERFSADRRSEALGRRILDLLGGTPSRP